MFVSIKQNIWCCHFSTFGGIGREIVLSLDRAKLAESPLPAYFMEVELTLEGYPWSELTLSMKKTKHIFQIVKYSFISRSDIIVSLYNPYD